MKETNAISALAALAHESRLRIFRLLAKHGDEGLAAGKIADKLGIPAATLSFHLKELSYAELVVDRRESRSVIYSINTKVFGSLVGFLTEECCGGHPELCHPCSTPTKLVRTKATSRS